VLDRPDFVAAAPTLPGDPRIRLPPASPHRYDGKASKVSHLRPIRQRLVAHARRLDLERLMLVMVRCPMTLLPSLSCASNSRWSSGHWRSETR